MRYALFLVLFVCSCGRGGFNELTPATNAPDTLLDLTLMITDPSAGALVPRITTLRGTCSKNVAVSLIASGGIEPVNFVGCEDGTFASVVTFVNGDGIMDVTVSASSPEGVVVSDTRAFRRTTTAPVLTLDSAVGGALELFSNADFVDVSGTCESHLAVTVVGAADASLRCNDGVWSYRTAARTQDGLDAYAFSQTDEAGNTTAATLDWTRDTQPPVIDGIVLNGGQSRATGNVLPLQINAHDNGGSGVGSYRVDTAADVSALPWLPTVPRTVTFRLISGSYTVNAQVRDRAATRAPSSKAESWLCRSARLRTSISSRQS